MKENRNIMRKENNENIGIGIVQFIFGLILLVMILFGFIGCGTTQYIPTTTVDRVVYKDTTLIFNDTIYIPIEKEVVKEVLPELDTSYLETSVAKSTAYLDTNRRKIHHTLEQGGEVKVIVDTFYTVTYVDRYIEKPVIEEVEVIKYKRDGLFWFSIIFNIITILLFAFRLYLKTKELK